MFRLLSKKLRLLPKQNKYELTVKVLKAVHLPQLDNRFLSSLLRRVGQGEFYMRVKLKQMCECRPKPRLESITLYNRDNSFTVCKCLHDVQILF